MTTPQAANLFHAFEEAGDAALSVARVAGICARRTALGISHPDAVPGLERSLDSLAQPKQWQRRRARLVALKSALRSALKVLTVTDASGQTSPLTREARAAVFAKFVAEFGLSRNFVYSRHLRCITLPELREHWARNPPPAGCIDEETFADIMGRSVPAPQAPQAPPPLHRHADAVAGVLELAVQAAGSDKPALVWAQLQAMAASPEPPAPLVRLDKNDDILYRVARGDEKNREKPLSRKAVSDRLRRRRERLATAR